MPFPRGQIPLAIPGVASLLVAKVGASGKQQDKSSWEDLALEEWRVLFSP